MARSLKSGVTNWMGVSAKGTKSIIKGVKSDAKQAGVRGGGKASSNNQWNVQKTGKGNSGSFGK